MNHTVKKGNHIFNYNSDYCPFDVPILAIISSKEILRGFCVRNQTIKFMKMDQNVEDKMFDMDKNFDFLTPEITPTQAITLTIANFTTKKFDQTRLGRTTEAEYEYYVLSEDLFKPESTTKYIGLREQYIRHIKNLTKQKHVHNDTDFRRQRFRRHIQKRSLTTVLNQVRSSRLNEQTTNTTDKSYAQFKSILLKRLRKPKSTKKIQLYTFRTKRMPLHRRKLARTVGKFNGTVKVTKVPATTVKAIRLKTETSKRTYDQG